MKESLIKLRIMLFLLSTTVIIGACTVSTETQRLTLLPPASVSATFGGVTISTASVGASGVFIEAGNTVVIKGFPNPPDELGVPDGEITVVAPAGVTVSTLSLSFSDLAGTDAGQQVLPETVTVSSEGNADNTFSVRIDFVAGTPALVVRNPAGFEGDGVENNRLTLPKDSTAATSIGTLSRCAYYAPDFTFMLGASIANANYRIAPAMDPRPVISPNFDVREPANNTNEESYQVTYEQNTGSITFGFSVVVQDCSAPVTVFSTQNPVRPGTTEDNPWMITDAAELQAVAFFVNNDQLDSNNPNSDRPLFHTIISNHFFELANDIDLANFGGAEGFVPIGVPYPPAGGADDNNFNGGFDCKGNTISNLTINRPTSDYQGLFGYILDKDTNVGFIRNCRLVNVNIVGRDGVGGLVGDAASKVSISNVHVQGEVRGRNAVGGLIGRLDGSGVRGKIERTSVHATVSGGIAVGGIFGYTTGSITEASYFNGAVLGHFVVGGLIGYGQGNGSPTTISNSYARGTVTGFSAVGGLLGSDPLSEHGPRITNYLNLMTVASSDLDAAVIERYRTDSSSQPSFERLVTFNYAGTSTALITQFDATPSVRPIGAIVGNNSHEPPMYSWNQVATTYADSTLAGDLPLVFGVDALAGFTGFTTEQLQSATAPGTAAAEPYNGFDTAVWDFGTETQYPALIPPADGGVFTLEEQRTTP